MEAKYVFVTGGVVSGLGKGIVAASLGRLLKQRGYQIASQKLDPYMNIDPGTMNPQEHGEVFVTDDGAETDLDLGHYERFINTSLTKYSNLTSGKVYWSVLNKERNGDYLGSTVQIIPHVTIEIKDFIIKNQEAKQADVTIVEVGGTTGDIESQPFLEAIRQLSYEVGRENCCFIHVCLVPYISGSNEYKTKPTQHSVKQLQALGIFPDIIVTRSDSELDQHLMDKIALFCNVDKGAVISNTTVDCLYEAPLMLHKNKLDNVVCKKLHLKGTPDLKPWKEMIKKVHSRKGTIKIALVGKYVKLHDSYLSIIESLNHASYEVGKNVEIKWVDSETLNSKNIGDVLGDVSGILVPGGFGERGIEGMILAAKYAREEDIPYFGICLGMQIATIEFARNVCNLENANSAEFSPKCKNPVIHLMKDQEGKKKGGTMRLGSYPCEIQSEDSIMFKSYGEKSIAERHRHRYEFNNEYREIMQENGLLLSGCSPDGLLVETVEIPKNRYFIGVQFHPEFKSRPNRPHPIFVSFLKAAMESK